MKNLAEKFAVFFVVLMVCFSFVSCAYSPAVNAILNTLASDDYIDMHQDGQIKQVGFVPDMVTIKDFTTLGIIFAESSAVIDSDGHIREGSKITFDMLMKEAQKLGADDIINLRIDEIHHTSMTEEIRMVSKKEFSNITQTYRDVEKEEKVQIITRRIEYKANALAIKYTDTIISTAN